MCEIFVSIFDIVIGFFILIDCCLFIGIGFFVLCFVKCMKCFMGLLLKNDFDFDDYWLFIIWWFFLLFSGIVFLWNIVEVYFIYEDKLSDIDVFWIMYIFVSYSLMVMFVYMLVLILFVMVEKELCIVEYRLLMILYYIFDMFVDLILFIVVCLYILVDFGLKSRFVVFIYLICDIILLFF